MKVELDYDKKVINVTEHEGMIDIRDVYQKIREQYGKHSPLGKHTFLLLGGQFTEEDMILINHGGL